jgi:hypothetical protein
MDCSAVRLSDTLSRARCGGREHRRRQRRRRIGAQASDPRRRQTHRLPLYNAVLEATFGE